MNQRRIPTAFATAERQPHDEIRRQAGMVGETPLLSQLLDAVSAIVLIINRQRQIVFANDACIELLGLRDAPCIYGLRPGEAMQCIHAHETEGGCGTAEACEQCGAIRAVLASQKGRREARECRILRKGDGEALDLLVWATPFPLEREVFTVVAISEISHEKRRRALERIFFHDILNDATAVVGLAQILDHIGPEEASQCRQDIQRAARKLVDLVESQRTLMQAENNELEPRPAVIESEDLVQELLNSYRSHPVAEGREIALGPAAERVVFTSDAALVRRVLSNMVKNALEASQSGQTVSIGCRALDGAVRFSVHNPTFMPRDVQLQVFQRSFSTKGADRGLGTYSMKLLTERYLGGEVSFTTSPEEGTTFFAQFPLSFQA